MLVLILGLLMAENSQFVAVQEHGAMNPVASVQGWSL